MDHQRDHGQIGEHLQNGLQAVFPPHRNQKKEKQREHEPQHHSGEKGHYGQRAGGEANDGEFDGQQHHQDQDANLHQPGQPVPLIGDVGHELGFVVRRSPGEPRIANSERRFLYPASFEIIANNGMYREITMPPMVMPRQPMMTGSSMASMSLVAASTSSS